MHHWDHNKLDFLKFRMVEFQSVRLGISKSTAKKSFQTKKFFSICVINITNFFLDKNKLKRILSFRFFSILTIGKNKEHIYVRFHKLHIWSLH